MSSALTGRLIFLQGGPDQPLHNLHIKVWRDRTLRRDPLLGETHTGLDGGFSIPFEAMGREIKVLLIAYVAKRTYDGTTPVDTDEKVFETTLHLEEDSTDLGAIRVPYWGYRTDFPTPRVAKVNGELPQAYTKGFKSVLRSAELKVAVADGPLLAENLLNASKPDAATIQKHQPKTLTLRVDSHQPGRTRSDAWLGDRLLNGFNTTLLVGKDVEDPGGYRARITWGDMPAVGEFDLTDVDVKLARHGEVLLPTAIALRIRQPGADGTWIADTTRTFAPTDGADWEAAKRVVRCQYLLQGALDGHITNAHMRTEMYSIAAHRHLRLNPVRLALLPHFEEISDANNDGDNFAWGPKGEIATNSALRVPHIHNRMMRLVACADWDDWSPRNPLTETHRYAKAAHLFWDVLTAYLDSFFAENQEDIVAQWAEVHAFSDEMVARSLPYEPPEVDPNIEWADTHESDTSSVPRDTVNGALRTVRPITHSNTPAEGEIERLKSFVRYAVFHATFNHTWVHDGQYDAMGEITYATLGLRSGSLGAADDPNILPTSKLLIQGMSTNTLGLHANYGFLLPDEEHDVPPGLKEALRARADDFAALGVDPNTLRSRINI